MKTDRITNSTKANTDKNLINITDKKSMSKNKKYHKAESKKDNRFHIQNYKISLLRRNHK